MDRGAWFRLQSIGSQRVRCNWVTSGHTCKHTYTHTPLPYLPKLKPSPFFVLICSPASFFLSLYPFVFPSFHPRACYWTPEDAWHSTFQMKVLNPLLLHSHHSLFSLLPVSISWLESIEKDWQPLPNYEIQRILFYPWNSFLRHWYWAEGSAASWLFIPSVNQMQKHRFTFGFLPFVVVQSISYVRLFCNLMDCSPPGYSVRGILQAGKLEWVAISSSRGSSWPRDWPHILCIAGRFFTGEPQGKPLSIFTSLFIEFQVSNK